MTIQVGELLFPLAMFTLLWGLGLLEKKETAWFLQWKYWKRLLICWLSWAFLALALLFELYKDGAIK
jgi:hypothetical protein